MICFVRHGQTDYNIQGILQGQLDIPLNDTGIKQAEDLSELLKDYKFDCIFCSPLIRAKLTAEIINKHHNIPMYFDDRLKELSVGDLQGQHLKNIDINDTYINPKKYNCESFDELYERVCSFYKEIEATDKNILIVSHGGVYKGLYKYLNQVDLFDSIPELKNCEVFKIK